MGAAKDDLESARGSASPVEDNTEVRTIDLENLPEGYAKCHYMDAPDGYPRLARWMASGDNAVTLRQFRHLQTRSLLHLQDELRALEQELHDLDARDEAAHPNYLTSRETAQRHDAGRTRLMGRIRSKWSEYAELALLSNRVACLEKPSGYEFRSIRNFWYNNRPLVEEEGFLFDRDDLVNLGPPGDVAWLDEFLLGLLVRFSCPPLRWIFSTRENRETNQKAPATVVYSTHRVQALKVSVVIVLLMALLSGPLYPLYLWTRAETLGGRDIAKIMGLQCGCTLLFGVVLAGCTKARRIEIFAACSAYMAVLIVFFGQVGS
ncbi:uncharacterized protein DNG_03104 [Cephalotrichum gorgonifer]|uniref:DUF6594 domain-containing protein n=1 Tax=Cephalotrichum gorgonifer TaxID=2041049 RepID=A0AAE8STN5_9PEZI|nr:uncharacterized protein DNG_03104 [Cephalotrichum gorgonifer]